MIFEKTARVEAPVARVWEMLLDPKTMGACVPGIEAIEVVSDTEYVVTVQVKVAFVSARFKVRTTITEMRPPEYLRSQGSGEDSTLANALRQSSEVFLSDQGDGTAELRTRLDVQLTGKLANFGLNIIKTKVDRMWDEFSRNLAERVQTGVTASQEPPVEAVEIDGAVEAVATERKLVWLDMDQAALDAAYDQAAYAPNRQQLLDRYAARSEALRSRRGVPSRHAYGPTPAEALDLYRADRNDAPINIFIHGGAWRAGAAKDCAFFADLFNDAGVHLVVPDFVNVGETEGSLFPMAEQVSRAIVWVCRNSERLGGDRRRIFLSGTSSGAHLATVALTSDWSALGFDACPVQAALVCSGIYDLEPVRRSARSKYVAFTDDMVDRLSPMRNLDRLKTPLIVAYGSLETPEFQRQAREFADAVTQRGHSLELIRAEGYNHFEIHETLGDPYDVLGCAVLRQMNCPTSRRRIHG